MEYRILGPLQVLDGEVEVPVGSPKERALLAVLLLHAGVVVSRDRLIDELWGESPPATAAKALNVHVSQLRKALARDDHEPVVTRSPGYVLDVEPERLDAVRFERLVAEARGLVVAGDVWSARRLLGEALALWRGPALAGVELEAAARNEVWRLEELRLAAEMDRIDCELALGLHEQLIGELESFVAEHPLRERLGAQLMLALYRSGRQAEALGRYRETRATLVEELGIEPSLPLQRLEKAILNQDPSLEAPPGAAHADRGLETVPSERKHNLPAQLTSFIGREQEIAELKELLATTRLVTLTGAGGSGKTRLAVQVAGDLVPEYLDGVWLVELAALSDANLVAALAAQVVGVKEEPARPLVETLTDALRTKRLLLVLDNCEHLLAACARLAELLVKACPRLTVLATSREPLGIVGETAWGVPTLSVPATARAGPAEALASEAVRLFIERARSANRSFTLGDDGAAAIVEICRRLDGIPLAIELAAVRVRLLTPEQIAARLDDRFALLTARSPTALPRHRTLRALIDWSYELLSEQERLLLRRLTVFAGGFSLEAAECVCGDGLEEQTVLDLLARLVDKSLVVADQHAETRYRLLETVREFARERLDAADQDAPLARRHADYYLAFAEDACADAERRGDARGWLRLAQAEHDNLRAALDFYAASADTTNEIRLASVLGDFWVLRGYYAEGRRRLESVLARRSNGDTLRATALHCLHRIVLSQHDLEAANAVGRERLALTSQLGDRSGIAWTLVGLANAASAAGDIDAARRMLGEAESLFRALDETIGLVVVSNDAGELALVDGDYGRAAERFNTGLALHERVGRPGRTLRTNLALALLLQGRVNEARPLYKQALVDAAEIGHTRAIAIALLGTAAVCDADAGDPSTVAHLLSAAESVLGKAGVEFDRSDSMLRDRIAGRIEAVLEATDLARALDAGRSLPITEAVDLALHQLR